MLRRCEAGLFSGFGNLRCFEAPGIPHVDLELLHQKQEQERQNGRQLPGRRGQQQQQQEEEQQGLHDESVEEKEGEQQQQQQESGVLSYQLPLPSELMATPTVQ
mmetsp:Transcript_71796/g.156331  ORF Transcript_71796/g.156331 Transcript_71796/m.156331 type:complete len:104 (-) Transcript_71796:29-340(-)